MVPAVFTLILIACCFYAMAYGGQPERQVALMLLVAAMATALVGYGFPQPRGTIRWPVMFVDFALVVGLMWVAFRADRLWPMVVTALQLITAAAHPALELAGKTAPRAYMIAIFMSGFLIPPVLALGTFLHRRRMVQTKR
ncbi:MAG: hypothetical protein MUE77_02690 [Sandarakinorhabdus sp.]|jgi:hypothetical protein|nr:hypothetical protein [Sandarakinorhabdus sp.]